MGAKENKELVRRLFIEGFPANPEGLDRFFHKDYVDHAWWKSLPGLKTTLRGLRAAYPNIEWYIEDIFAEGDRVCVRCVMKLGATVGKMKTAGSTSIFRLHDGKIAESWGHGEPVL